MDHGTAFGRIAFSCAKEEVVIMLPLPLVSPSQLVGDKVLAKYLRCAQNSYEVYVSGGGNAIKLHITGNCR